MFTSDFPIVEGAQLLELTDITENGQLTVAPVLPIRGKYQMQVEVTPVEASAFSPFTQSLLLAAPENPVKYRNTAILLAILLLTGFVSGWIVGGDQTLQPGEAAPRPARMLLSTASMIAIIVLLVINISAEIVSAQESGGFSGGAPNAVVQQSGGIRAELSGDTFAMVGRMAAQTVTITDEAGQPVSDVELNIQVLGLEHDELVFFHETTPNENGIFSWREQFFDGAPHQVTVEVTPLEGSNQSFQPIQIGHEIDVAGIAPPLFVRFVSLLYFTAFYAISLAIGFWLHRRSSARITM